MYVVVNTKSGAITVFGLTPRKANELFRRGLLSYDGPPLDTRRCSPALCRRLQAEERKDFPYSCCRINHEAVAVCRTGKPRLLIVVEVDPSTLLPKPVSTVKRCT
jgi:hypothetical protein